MTAQALRFMKWGFCLLFININFGRWDLLPNFLGVFLLLQALRSQEMTETERRLCPLLWILITDYFLHWIWTFDYVLESLIVEVIRTYVIYVLLGEIYRRIEGFQPEEAKLLHYIRIMITALPVLGYLFGEYGNEIVMTGITIGIVIVLIALLGMLAAIKPVDTEAE